ncbi:hypothetical protein H4R34_003466 [Dimargaris verticillata]|uniref:ABC transporter domain-containing protein n=1 Tax=Dimargaris verticillata TaxID=2761393 RepID=A0A9W8EC00_9FUNG|nr:hypothetical protein H4R34_003466 [Dimargaris verticillata]
MYTCRPRTGLASASSVPLHCCHLALRARSTTSRAKTMATLESSTTDYAVQVRPSWVRSVKALLRKSVLSCWRNQAILVFELLTSIYFLALLVGLNQSTKNDMISQGAESLPALTSACSSCLHLAYTNSTPVESFLDAFRDLTDQSEPFQVHTRAFSSRQSMFDYYNAHPSETVAGVTLPVLGISPTTSSSNTPSLVKRAAEPLSYALHCNHTALGDAGFVETRCLTAQIYVERALSNVFRKAQGLPLLPSPIARPTDPNTYAGKMGPRISDDSDAVGLARFRGKNYESTYIVYIGPYLTALGLSMTLVSAVVAIVIEKERQVKPLLLMLGMPESAYTASVVVFRMGLYFVTAVIGTLIICAGKFFQSTHWFLVFWFFYLYLLTTIGIGMAVAAFINDSRRASNLTQLGIIILIFLAVIGTLFVNGNSVVGEWFYYLISPAAFTSALDFMIRMEITSTPITLSNFGQSGPLPRCLTMLIIDTVLYIILGWYLHCVVPGSAGRPLPWYFPFHKSYWIQPASHQGPINAKAPIPSPNNTTCWSLEDQDGSIPLIRVATRPSDASSTAMVERDDLTGVPESGRDAVQISHLAKTFESQRASRPILGPLSSRFIRTKRARRTTKVAPLLAVNNLSLNLHQNQILALLGHNGAGKTTTVSILSTALGPTRGQVRIHGLDLPTDTDNSIHAYHTVKQVQSQIALCPQHDVFLDFLTGYDHLRLFMEIRGIQLALPCQQASATDPQALQHAYLTQLLGKVQLQTKGDTLVTTYSGGMKRRLSVALALLGDARLILLDEPTTGMDVYSRKYTWEFIQEAKLANRAMVLTSHSMEEADVLGDRIAIMAKGQIQAAGSSLFLKNRFGSGYRLHLTKAQSATSTHDANADLAMSRNSWDQLQRQWQQLDATIHRHVPAAQKVAETDYDLTFAFSSGTETSAFPALFAQLEASIPQQSLGIVAIGLSMTTLEEVFLKLNAEPEASSESN